MQITKTFRRAVATVILTAGLAYPACAAVCPKGIGGCPSPGRCFLFVDADGNTLCDYTARTSSQVQTAPGVSRPEVSQAPVTVPTTPAPDLSLAQVTTTPAPGSSVASVTPAPDTTMTALRNTPYGELAGSLPVSAVVTEILLFLLFAGILFALIRTGMAGVRIERSLPALGLSSLLALGLSLMTTSFLTGGTIVGTTYALIFMGAGTLLAAGLWHAGVMTRKVVLASVITATLAGFVFLAPIMPMELGGIVNVLTGVSALNTGVIVICAVVAITLVVGRTFCGSICPVGSVQELAYAVPVKKTVIRRTEIPELVRLAIFGATVIAAAYLIDLMAFTGLYDLFSLTLSASLLVAAGLVLVSVFLYRPVCRILCPFGVLFSIFAEFSLFRLRRTETCISCKKCEKACPTRTAGKTDSKRECYLCGRCTDVCPVDTALSYRR
ncbi:MAG: 4Fe-4S binding protein [Methanoregula sp.]|nr:4Fe-4S binding protein [Methanoregula sp.]